MKNIIWMISLFISFESSAYQFSLGQELTRFLPMGKSQGMSRDGMSCEIDISISPAGDWARVYLSERNLPDTGDSKKWSVGEFWDPVMNDKNRETRTFKTSIDSVEVRSLKFGEHLLMPVIPPSVSVLSVEKLDQGISVRVRTGLAYTPFWENDYTCVVNHLP